jgi:hypothetical protein
MQLFDKTVAVHVTMIITHLSTELALSTKHLERNPASLQAINIVTLFSFDTAACVPVPVLLYEKKKGVVLWVLLYTYIHRHK